MTEPWYAGLMEPAPGLTAERLREILHYDPDTGVWRWKVSPNGRCPVGSIAGRICISRRQINVDGRGYYSGQLAVLYMTGEFPPDQVDHINRQGDDDRWDNLRPATSVQNSQNQSLRSDNRSGYKGVYWSPKVGRWRVAIGVNYKRINLGYFDDLKEAAAAYDRAAIRYFGEFAKINGVKDC